MKYTRKQQLVGLAEQFGIKATEVMITMMEAAMSDLPDVAFEGAIGRAMVECDRFPPVAKLRELAGCVKVEDRAQIAWGALNRAMDRNTSYDSICFSDPILNAVVRLNYGGWERAKALRDKDQGAWRSVQPAHFRNAYSALCRNPPEASKCGHLPGIIEKTNGPAEELQAAYPHLQLDSPGIDLGRPVWIDCGLPALPGLPLLERPAEQPRALPAPRPEPPALPAPAVMANPPTVDEVRERMKLKMLDPANDAAVEANRRKLLELGE